MIELADALVALLEGLPGPGAPIQVTGASFDVPLEVRPRVVNGRLTFLASLPQSRFRSGVMSPVQRAHIEVGLEDQREVGAPSGEVGNDDATRVR